MTPEPAEHLRFHDYVHALSQVSDSDECDLLAAVLADPDCMMADSAVSDHLDRRAAALGDGEAFTTWAQRIAGAVHGRALSERRLREWALIKDIDSARSWDIADLVEASDWLQRSLVEHTTARQALTVLAGQGRTRRIRNTARARLAQRLT